VSHHRIFLESFPLVLVQSSLKAPGKSHSRNKLKMGAILWSFSVDGSQPKNIFPSSWFRRHLNDQTKLPFHKRKVIQAQGPDRQPRPFSHCMIDVLRPSKGHLPGIKRKRKTLGWRAMAPCVTSPQPETDLPEAKQLRLCLFSKKELTN